MDALPMEIPSFAATSCFAAARKATAADAPGAEIGYGNTLGTNYPFQYTINSPSTTSLAPIVLPNGQTASIENTFGAINLQDPNHYKRWGRRE
jgi:hypothetical protein